MMGMMARARLGDRAHRSSGRPSGLAIASAIGLLWLASWVFAHATVVFGTLTVEPNPPPANVPIVLDLFLEDPTGTPVEDAIVRAEWTPVTADPVTPDPETAAEPGTDGFAEPLVEAEFSEVEPGRYRAEVVVPVAGSFQVLLRDQTFRQEEATQIVSLDIGTGDRVAAIDFLLPPTATGGGLAAWLLWLVAIPLVAGIVVTILVLRGGPTDADASTRDPQP